MTMSFTASAVAGVLGVSDAGIPAGLLPARQQMAVSLGWHIVLASFGVAFPAMIFVLHMRWVRYGDLRAMELARRWSKVAAVLFAVGAVSGTVLSFEMGLLWPGLMSRFGDVLGLPFAFEGISFFAEAIFLGIYLYGWDRLPPRRHAFMLLPMMAAGIIGTYCVVSVNAWMNRPVGFRVTDNGQVVDVNPWAALLNQGALLQSAHMWVAAFMVVGFLVASVYAVGLLRGRNDRHHRLALRTALTFAGAAALLQPLIGHVLGLLIAKSQPSKLAAFELAPKTEGPAPLRIGGIWIDGETRFAITIPRLGSLIARNSFDAAVPGLASIPEANRPPVNLTHLAFQGMVGIGSLLALAVVCCAIAQRRGAQPLRRRWVLRGIATAGPLAVLALELGWIATEVGRQPWTIFGILRTNDAASRNGGLWWSFGAVLLLYLGLTLAVGFTLSSMARRWRAGDSHLQSPYGPGSRLADVDYEAGSERENSGPETPATPGTPQRAGGFVAGTSQ